MKPYAKDNFGLFICEECGCKFKNLNGLSKHLYFSHNGKEHYFNKWLRDSTDKCKVCGNNTKFKNLQIGCIDTCSKECKKELTKMTNLKKYGVEFPLQHDSVKLKSKQTCLQKYGKISYSGTDFYKKSILDKYGVENVFQLDRVKKKCKKSYIRNLGVENPSQSEKIKQKKEQTCMKNHGVKSGLCLRDKIKKGNLKNNNVEFPMQSDSIKCKSRLTCMNKYGVEYIHQHYEIHEKSQKTALKIKQFRNTGIWYQGSYELDFLENYYDKYPDITRGPRIKYEFKGITHYYFPDFYVPSKNLVVECKNSYLAERDKCVIEEKRKATIIGGFNWVLIVNKDYTNLTI